MRTRSSRLKEVGLTSTHNLCFRAKTRKNSRWPSGRASDSVARGLGFDPHEGRRVVSLSKIHLPPKSTGNTQESGGSVPT